VSLITYERENRVAHITLNRPEKRNSLNLELIGELKKVWIDFRDDNELRVAVLSGAGDSFCAGADILRTGELDDTTSGKRRLLALEAVPGTYHVNKPVIGAFHGYVLGAGLWLALLGSDIRISAEDTQFGAPDAKWGRPVMFTAPLFREISPAIAYEILYGSLISARRAYETGFINKLVPREQLISEARTWAERITESSPLMLRTMKEVIRENRDQAYNDMISSSRYFFDNVRGSEDFEEGRRAFAEKRKPVWKAV